MYLFYYFHQMEWFLEFTILASIRLKRRRNNNNNNDNNESAEKETNKTQKGSPKAKECTLHHFKVQIEKSNPTIKKCHFNFASPRRSMCGKVLLLFSFDWAFYLLLQHAFMLSETLIQLLLLLQLMLLMVVAVLQWARNDVECGDRGLCELSTVSYLFA